MDPRRVSDRRLVAACLGGDEAAWSELWRRFSPLVKAVARRTGCTADEARDVLQAVGLVALGKLDTVREVDRVSSWLAGVARFKALELIRRRGGMDDLDPELPSSASDADDVLVRDQELGHLRTAFVRLDPRCQRVLTRLDLTEPAAAYAEVAEEEGLATASVGPIRRRCLNRLRKIFEGLSRSPGSTHSSGGD